MRTICDIAGASKETKSTARIVYVRKVLDLGMIDVISTKVLILIAPAPVIPTQSCL